MVPPVPDRGLGRSLPEELKKLLLLPSGAQVQFGDAVPERTVLFEPPFNLSLREVFLLSAQHLTTARRMLDGFFAHGDGQAVFATEAGNELSR